MKAELAALTGQGGAGAAVRAQLEQSLEQLLESPSVSDEDRQILSRYLGVKEAQAELRDFQAEYSRILDSLSVSQDRIQIQQRAGTLTETQARQQQAELYGAIGQQIEGIIPKLERLDAAGELPELQTALDRARNKIEELGVATDDLSQQFRGTIGNAIGDFFTDAATWADNFGEAAENALNNLARSMLNIINQRLGLMLVDSLFGAIAGVARARSTAARCSPTGARCTAAARSAGRRRTLRRMNPMTFAGAPRLHSGLRSDEFPAILQSGEQVLSRAEVAAGERGPVINIINPPQQPQVNTRRDGGMDVVDVVFRPIEEWLGGRIMRGDGLAGTIERRFAPSAGVVR